LIRFSRTAKIYFVVILDGCFPVNVLEAGGQAGLHNLRIYQARKGVKKSAVNYVKRKEVA
jgi:hypothetical protein